jgi:hypothetical protein
MEAAVDSVAVVWQNINLGLSRSVSCGVRVAPSQPCAAHRLANLETLELRVIQIQWLVVPYPTMRSPERSDLVHASKVARLPPHNGAEIGLH